MLRGRNNSRTNVEHIIAFVYRILRCTARVILILQSEFSLLYSTADWIGISSREVFLEWRMIRVIEREGAKTRLIAVNMIHPTNSVHCSMRMGTNEDESEAATKSSQDQRLHLNWTGETESHVLEGTPHYMKQSYSSRIHPHSGFSLQSKRGRICFITHIFSNFRIFTILWIMFVIILVRQPPTPNSIPGGVYGL